jgi:diguanylate cyclase (GGDEF)-like protein
VVISLRKAMDMDLEESFRVALKSYRDVLAAIAESGVRAYPPAGEALKQTLTRVREELNGSVTPGMIEQCDDQVSHELRSWGDSAGRFYHESADEMRGLVLLIASAASQVGDRDQRYGEHLHGLAQQLESAARMDNVAAMRQSLGVSAVELVKCVNRMTEEGKTAVEKLRARVSKFETRMQELERLAALDPLTGLCNRRVLERQLEYRIESGSPFCVIYLDLNGFKELNDTLGHLAADELLKRFAAELRQCVRPTDCVGRSGGDEFVALVDGVVENTIERAERIKKLLNGAYEVSAARQKVDLTAAVGIAVWKKGMTGSDLLRAADDAMYQDKRKFSGRKTPGAAKP